MFQVLLFYVWVVKELPLPQPSFSFENDNINSFSESENLHPLSHREGRSVWEGEGVGLHSHVLG